MTTYDEMPADPFVTCLFDAPLIAVWRFDGEPEAPRYEVSAVPDVMIPNDRIAAAMQCLPAGAPWRLVLDA